MQRDMQLQVMHYQQSLGSAGNYYSTFPPAQAHGYAGPAYAARPSTTEGTGMDVDEPSSVKRSPERKKYSMGWRADCQKCQDHVPGHYGHLL